MKFKRISKTSKNMIRSAVKSKEFDLFLTKVDPTVATVWLGMNTHNRTMSNSHVRRLQSIMERGHFMQNGDTIRFSKDGVLLDGQHRLAAIIQSGLELEMAVAVGVDSDAHKTIDVGKARSLGDALNIEGFKNYNNVAAAIMYLNRIFQMIGRPKGFIGDITDGVKFATANPDFLDAVADGVQLYGISSPSRLMPTSRLSAFVYIMSHADRDMAMRFWTGVMQGSNLKPRTPQLTLRNRLLEMQANEPAGDIRRTVNAYVFKSWNYYIAQKQLKQLRFGSNETFPLPYGFPVDHPKFDIA